VTVLRRHRRNNKKGTKSEKRESEKRKDSPVVATLDQVLALSISAQSLRVFLEQISRGAILLLAIS
jgi:hypothetical protein